MWRFNVEGSVENFPPISTCSSFVLVCFLLFYIFFCFITIFFGLFPFRKATGTKKENNSFVSVIPVLSEVFFFP